MNSYTVKKPCNHGLHLFLTIVTFGLWGIFVWPFAAMVGRKTTVRHQGPLSAGQLPQQLVPLPPAQRAPYQLPMPQPNAVNPYTGTPYFDGNLPMRPIEYPPQAPSVPWHGAR